LVHTEIERAFSLFVDNMIDWWNPSHHVIAGRVVQMEVERRVGGAIYDRTEDGSVSKWGTVVAIEPPNRFVFTWHVSPEWVIEPNPEKASEVEVLFTREGPGITRVSLEHRHFDRHGPGWEKMRDAVSAPESWAAGLRRLADLAAAAN
jgi:uncharacterized protein YndB with AHSA1/START domain